MSEKASRKQLEFSDGPTLKVTLDWRLVQSTEPPASIEHYPVFHKRYFMEDVTGDKQNRSVWQAEASTLTHLENVGG